MLVVFAQEEAWIAFHQLRIDELPKKWSQFTPQLSPIICQHVNYELYAELKKSKLCGTFGDVACNTDVEVPELNEDEKNIIRYAAGYIPFKKTRKMIMIECLSNRAFKVMKAV